MMVTTIKQEDVNMEMKKRMEGHLRMLCEKIGARPTGSEANRAAVEYACGEFERFGLSVSKQEFDCMDWREEDVYKRQSFLYGRQICNRGSGAVRI